MGTPEFALPSMEKILNSRHRIVGVVTQPDRPRGRGKKLAPTPVKQFALDHHLSPILQPEKMKDPDFQSRLAALSADVFVVVAFRILPEAVFTMPAKGTINLHPSLLPKYRGAAPINWTIIRGENLTGITTIFLRKEIDAGNIIFQREMPVYPDDTAGTLHDRLAPAGGELLVETLDAIAEDRVEVTAQDESLVSSAPKLSKAICRLNFDQPARQVRQWIHGLSPFPGAYTFFRGEILKLYHAEARDINHQRPPGTILKADASGLWVACQSGAIAVLELQLPGRKRLTAAEFLRGTEMGVGEMLG